MRRSGSAVLASIVFCLVLLGAFRPADALARESGIQGTPDGKRILVNKDVGAERYAIAQDEDDRSATGNVFFTDARPPAFLVCTAAGGNDFSCSVGDPCPSSGRESGIQRRPDGKGILVSKDVGGERYAITENLDDGSLTGNVFFTDGRPPVFLFCEALGGNAYSCSGADRCRDTTCAPYAFLANITLPADFFSVPPGCPSFQAVGTVQLPADFFATPSTTRGPLAVGLRQVVGNNPFGGLTKSAGAASVGMLARARTGGAHAASTFVDVTNECPAGGSEVFHCEVGVADDGSNVTVARQDENACAFPQNDGGLQIENGVVFTAVPDFADCDPVPFATGVEQLEERSPLSFDFVDAEGTLLERHIEQTTRLVTYGDGCENSAGSVLTAEADRRLTGDEEVIIYGDDEVHLLTRFDEVEQTIEHSPAPECAPTYTRTAGSTFTTDGFTGESFTTVYGGDGVRYTLEDSELNVSGSLTSQCTGSQSTFSYRTVRAPLFDPSNPDGCPRGGEIEISSNGVSIGRVIFTPSGGIQLVEVDGGVRNFASCNDADLLLRCE